MTHASDGSGSARDDGGGLDPIPARELSDEQLATEAARIGAVIDDGFGEHSGSPGEWYYERLEEIELQQNRRSVARSMAPCEHGVADWETCPKCRGWSEG